MRQFFYVAFAAVALFCAPAAVQAALSCKQFNAQGGNYTSTEEVVNSRATRAQTSAFKDTLAPYAANLSGRRKKALDRYIRQDMLAHIMRETLAIVRHECYEKPGRDFDPVVRENFNPFLDELADRMGW